MLGLSFADETKTVPQKQLNVDEALAGTAACRPNDVKFELLEQYSLCYLLDHNINTCSAMNKFISMANVKGIQKLDQYLRTKSGDIVEKLKNEIISDYGNSLHSDWVKTWKGKTDADPSLLAKEQTVRAAFEAEGRELVSNGGNNPPRYKLDSSVPGKYFDIANLSFDQLPPEWKGENQQAAQQIIDYFFEKYPEDPGMLKNPQAMAEVMHNQWLERNRDKLYQTGDKGLEARIKADNGIPPNKPLPKRLVSEKVLANRKALQQWAELNQPFHMLPENVKKQNLMAYRQVSTMFDNGFVNRMGKDAAFARSGMKMAMTASRVQFLKALKKWGLWKAAALPTSTVMAMADATPTGCAETVHRFANYEEGSCELKYDMSPKVYDFLALDPITQNRMLRDDPATCEYYKKLGETVLNQVKNLAPLMKEMSDIKCNGNSEYSYSIPSRNEKREYQISPQGTITKMTIRPHMDKNAKRKYEVRYSPEGKIEAAYYDNNGKLVKTEEDFGAAFRTSRYTNHRGFSTDLAHAIEIDSGTRGFADVFYTARISPELLSPVLTCCRSKNVSPDCLLQQRQKAAESK